MLKKNPGKKGEVKQKQTKATKMKGAR